MRLSEDHPLDPEVLAELEAIDSTLRGEAVDPAHAELAELALLLQDERAAMPVDAARTLDERVARRFAPADAEPASAAGSAPLGPSPTSRRPRPARWALRPSFGIVFAAVATAAVIGVVVINPFGSTPTTNDLALSPPAATATTGSTLGTAAGSAGVTRHGAATRTPSNAQALSDKSPHSLTPAPTNGVGDSTSKTAGSNGDFGAATTTASSSGAPSAPLSSGSASSAPSTVIPTPETSGRKITQAAQLQLTAPGDRINEVSQELFTAVGLSNGIVKSSTITAAGSNGYAVFQLSIPSGNLATTMSALSTLRYAHVASETNATQDVTGQFNADAARLADARALRTSLLKQLAAATTQAEIDSLTAQIHDAEASIASDQATLARLGHQIDYSNVTVQINAATIPPAHASTTSSGGFTLGTAWHDAIRVLTIVAGVSLIALAVLIPLGLMAALIAWIAYWVRRRRREAALDAA